VPVPAVVSVTAGVVEPGTRRSRASGGQVEAGRHRDGGDLGLDASQVGWAGAGQDIVDISPAPARQAGEKIEDDGTAHERIVAFLEQLKVI
jgi:electron transfer flavoprotein beta subunit